MMRAMRSSRLPLAGLLLSVLLTACSTADNSRPPAELKPIADPLPVKLLWSRDTGEGAHQRFLNKMQPLLAADRVYTVDTAGQLQAFDTVTGRRLWRHDTGLPALAGPGGDGQRLLVTSREGDVALLEVDDRGAREVWRVRVASEIRSKAVLDGEQVFLRSVDGKLHALNSKDGSVLWSVSRRVPPLSLTGTSSPLVTPERVISGFDNGKLVAFNRKDGSVDWELTVSVPRGRSEIERLVDLDGQFVLRDGVVYVSAYQGDLTAVIEATGQVLWTRKFSSFQAIEIDDDSLYLTDDQSHLWSIDRRSGSAFWKQDELDARKLTAPRLVGDYLVAGDLKGYLHWFDKRDGRILARTQPDVKSYLAQPLALQDRVAIVLDSTAQLFALQLNAPQ